MSRLWRYVLGHGEPQCVLVSYASEQRMLHPRLLTKHLDSLTPGLPSLAVRKPAWKLTRKQEMKASGPKPSRRAPHRCSASPSTDRCTAAKTASGRKAVTAAATPPSTGLSTRLSALCLLPAMQCQSFVSYACTVSNQGPVSGGARHQQTVGSILSEEVGNELITAVTGPPCSRQTAQGARCLDLVPFFFLGGRHACNRCPCRSTV